MELKSIMLDEITQTEKDKYCIELYVKSKTAVTKPSSQIQRRDWWLPEVWRMGGRGAMGGRDG